MQDGLSADNRVEVYTHSRDCESAEDILLCYGVNIKGNKRKRNELLKQKMVGPHCPFCMTANIPDSQFCCQVPQTDITRIYE